MLSAVGDHDKLETSSRNSGDSFVFMVSENVITNKHDIPSAMQYGRKSSKAKLTDNETIIHMLKGNMGTGILAMPEAFKNAGITVGSFGLALVGLMCVHCMQLLLKSSRVLCEKTGVESMDYATVAESAFAHGPLKFRKFSKAVRYMTNGFICVTQIGFCTVYFTFVAQNIELTIKNYIDDFEWSYVIIMCFLLIVIIPLNLIPNLKFLAPISLFANFLQITALAIIFYYLFTDVPPMNTVQQFGSWKGIPLFFGTAVFAFEGIALIMPVENSMQTPKSYVGLTGILNTCMVITVCMYIAMGFYGYLKYGEDVLSSITLNLPDEVLADVVRIFYATAITVSFAIQFYVPMSIMWPAITGKYHLDEKGFAVSYGFQALFRLFFVLLTFVLGAAIPDFGIVISVIGSFGGAYLSMILPAALELVTFWESGITWLTIFKNLVISIVGVIGLVTGLYSAALVIQANHV